MPPKNEDRSYESGDGSQKRYSTASMSQTISGYPVADAKSPHDRLILALVGRIRNKVTYL
jgi:hypothetical protein